MLEERRAAGKPAPALDRRPALPEYLEFEWHAYFDLQTCRSQGFSGPGPIPWDSVVDYGRYHGLDRDEIDRLIRLVRAMETVVRERTKVLARAEPTVAPSPSRASPGKGSTRRRK